ncbi:hypothetical protein ACU5DF_02360 [Aliivibrio wodanis]
MRDLALVGEGAAGKTSLVNRLIGNGYNAHEPQTHGIKINKLEGEMARF